jgi:drug/metabolite transporter (DMT)-like permease
VNLDPRLQAITFGCGLVAAIALGAGDFLSARTARSAGVVAGGFVIAAVGTVLSAVVLVVGPGARTSVSATGLAHCLVGCALMAAGTAVFMAGLRVGPVSLVSPLSATYPILATLIGVVVFGGTLSPAQLAAIVAVVIGVLLAGGVFSPRGGTRSRGPLLGVVAAVLWGMSYPVLAQGMHLLGWRLGTVLEFAVIALMFGVILCLPGRGGPAAARRALRSPVAYACGVLQLLGVTALSVGIDGGAGSESALIVVVLSACYPLLTIFLALRRFEERVRVLELSGALTGVAGVIVLAVV